MDTGCMQEISIILTEVAEVNINVLTVMVVDWRAQTLCFFDFSMWLLTAIHFKRVRSNNVCYSTHCSTCLYLVLMVLSVEGNVQQFQLYS
jgi:hypothetical protein